MDDGLTARTKRDVEDFMEKHCRESGYDLIDFDGPYYLFPFWMRRLFPFWIRRPQPRWKNRKPRYIPADEWATRLFGPYAPSRRSARPNEADVISRGAWHVFLREGGWKTVTLWLVFLGGVYGGLIFMLNYFGEPGTGEFLDACYLRHLYETQEKYGENQKIPDAVFVEIDRQCVDELFRAPRPLKAIGRKSATKLGDETSGRFADYDCFDRRLTQFFERDGRHRELREVYKETPNIPQEALTHIARQCIFESLAKAKGIDSNEIFDSLANHPGRATK